MAIRYVFRCVCNNEWEGDETQKVCSKCDAVLSGPTRAHYDASDLEDIIPISQAIGIPRRIAIQNIAHEIGNLTADKNAAYGNSVATVDACLKVFFPSGVPTRKYQHAMLFTRILDKMMRIATNETAFGENPYRDIAGYAIMGALINNEQEVIK